MDKSIFPGYDGQTAYAGLLRFHNKNEKWRQKWGHFYNDLVPSFQLIATTAFGTAFGLQESGLVAIFWPETGELEPIHAAENDFYQMIYEDPYSTIDFELYVAAVDFFGKPALHEHFGFIIPLALGGNSTPENLQVKSVVDNYRAMALLAQQISDIPIGATIDSVRLEN